MKIAIWLLGCGLITVSTNLAIGLGVMIVTACILDELEKRT